MHREAVGCGSTGDPMIPTFPKELPICVSMLGMVWEEQMQGNGDPFFPRIFFVGRVSGALSVPQNKCLVTLRYSLRADLALGVIGGASGEGKPRGQDQVSALPTPTHICSPGFQL